MANQQLRNALQDAGLEPEGLADLIQVDAKTVHRWLAGRPPYPRHRQRVAKALGRDVHDLWPGLEQQPDQPAPASVTTRTGAGKRIVAFAEADDQGAPDWFELLGQANDKIDLLDLTLTDLSERGDLPALLKERATLGCQIRILIAHPDSAHLMVAEAEQNPEQQIAQRPQLASEADDTLDLLTPLANRSDVEVRTFIAPGYHSILRADNHMLVITHTWGTTTTTAPLLQLNTDSSPTLLAKFAAHYDAIWQQAAPAYD